MSASSRPLLTVVVPVFNQAASIVANLEVIRERVGQALGDELEIVVVSDGSIDATEEELVTQAHGGTFRVFHYDRNLGKGYAVKLGALEAEGEWIGFVDADLDLDPSDLAAYVKRAQEHNLDFAIGSKRHPDSQVSYPKSRVVASWLFQQLVRVLFRLNVTDTQVGLKVFRRAVAEQVLPLLLVKRYAFDIELLAVSRVFGFTRIEEMPIRLDYQFAGSGVRSRAVLRALVDTAAIFYRLRILHYYQRRRRLAGTFGFTRPQGQAHLVSVLLPRGERLRQTDFPSVEIVEVDDTSIQGFRAAAAASNADIIAVIEPGVRAAGNWLSATTPFLARPEIGAVVTPKMAPSVGSVRARAAAAVGESRVGAGLGYFRSMPGNVRYVRHFPASAIVIRRETFLALPADVEMSDIVGAVDASGARVLYTPESVLVAPPPPLFRPHLAAVFHRGREFGRDSRVQSLALLAVGLALAVLLVVWADRIALVTTVLAYVVVIGVAALVATLRYQSVRVGVLAAAGIIATHLVYVLGVVRGLLQS